MGCKPVNLCVLCTVIQTRIIQGTYICAGMQQKPNKKMLLRSCDVPFSMRGCISVKAIHSREDFLSRIFYSTRPRHESDCQVTCNLLLHMQQKVVINLVAAEAALCSFAANKSWIYQSPAPSAQHICRTQPSNTRSPQERHRFEMMSLLRSFIADGR